MNAVLQASFERRFPGGPVIRVEDFATRPEVAVTVLFGASGSGKTTLLRAVAGLDRPVAGSVRFDGRVWYDAHRSIHVPARHRRVGLVPQDYSLFPHLTVAGNVGYGLRGRSNRAMRVAELLEWLGLEDLEKRYPGELSGGQQQRVALARALAPRPGLLLLDEPLAALDQPTRLRLRGELRGWLREAGIPALLVTHDRDEAQALGDDIAVMSGGRLVQQGPVSEVFARPGSAEVADILLVETMVPGVVESVADGIARVRCGEVMLKALAPETGMREVMVGIRAEDVSLSAPDDSPASPRNRLAGLVRELCGQGVMVRVEVECGFRLVALLTREACAEMALKEGSRVVASVKAPRVHLMERR
ncbi:ABC transporter ATP-binding protein [Haloferula sargassicola]|uniref:Fe(3+) ions import ATP-binding protein FbpC n=1 Tax=Haloferula sargassicola TaxID=490096 RepID=A0ABP9UMA5_9BACT